MQPRARIGQTSVSAKTRLSAIETSSILWRYNESNILYNQNKYTYDGIVTYDLFEPKIRIKGEILRVRTL